MKKQINPAQDRQSHYLQNYFYNGHMSNASNNGQISQEQFGSEGKHPSFTQNQQIPVQNQ